MNLFNLGILLTRKCNQQCYYCNNFNTDSSFIEIDIDYLNWILNIYSYHVSKLHVELSGGEPGIVKNIDDVFETLMNHINVKKITVLSNGLIRKLGYNLEQRFEQKLAHYYEHFCLEIRNKDILFFYPELPFYDLNTTWIKFILVLSDITLNSLLNNFEYFKTLYHLPIAWKSLTPKTKYPTQEYMDNLNLFYKLLLGYNSKALNDSIFLKKQQKLKKNEFYKMCSKISIFQFIDMENKKIGMCSMQVEQSDKYDITEKNIIKAIKGQLFSYNDFCTKCYKVNSNAKQDMVSRLLFKTYSNI